MIADKEYWGHGYGTDAMLVLMRLAFDKLKPAPPVAAGL